ncbi:hypothetical protein AC579_9469 [Pseudocercospora musae]|uniref:Uncharacterized protein n=1 Tax=Pseudocercospora musae TaxID=113226 RepID=A0A139I9T4_9PEZI|nr:hypothetical protein AC579_9469 [Pseudocercospora musae]
MALPIDQQLCRDATLSRDNNPALGPVLLLQNDTFFFSCQTLAHTGKTKDGQMKVKTHRMQDKNYKNNVPRQLFATLTKPLFDLASKMTPGFPELPKFAVMHIHNRTNEELLKLLGLAVTFVSKKSYDTSQTGVSAVINAPQVSPIPLYDQYMKGFQNSRNFLFDRGLRYRGDEGTQFLDNVESYLRNNPQQSPLAQYFPGQQPQFQQPPPPPLPSSPVPSTAAVPNPPAIFGAPQVNQSGPAAIAHPASQQFPQPSMTQATAFTVAAPNPPANVGVSYPAQHTQPPQFAGSQAMPVNFTAPNFPVNLGIPQVSQSNLAAVNYPAQQVQFPQVVGGQAAAFPFPPPNAQANFGAFQVNQPGPAATTYPAPQMQLQQPGWSQATSVNSAAPNPFANFGATQVNQLGSEAMALAQGFAPLQQGLDQSASFNSVAPYAPVNFGAGQYDEAAMMYPAQQMPAPQPDLAQGNSSSPMDQLSPMIFNHGVAFDPMGPSAPVDGGVDEMYQAGPAAIDPPSAGMDQESPAFAAPPAHIDPGMRPYDNVAMDFPSQDMETPLLDVGQGAPLNSQAFLPYAQQGVDEVGELWIPTEAEVQAFIALQSEQRAQLHPVSSSSNAHPGVEQYNQDPVEKTAALAWAGQANPHGLIADDGMNLQFHNDVPEPQTGLMPGLSAGDASDGSSLEQIAMPSQPQSLQATDVAVRDPSGLQELGGDQGFAQTSPVPAPPAFVDVGAEMAEFQVGSSFVMDDLVNLE